MKPSSMARKGYTLTELLIAIAVITTLIGALALGAQQYRVRAHNATAQVCARELVTLQQQNQTDSQLFKALTAAELQALKACNDVYVSAGSNDQTLQTSQAVADEGVAPGIIGAASGSHYAYLVRHAGGNRTYAATEGNVQGYGEDATRDAAVLSELSDSRTLVASASGGSGGSGGSPMTAATCAAAGGIYYQTTYGNASMPICQVPSDCPALSPYTTTGGVTKNATFMSGVGCSYATRQPTITFNLNDMSLINNFTVTEGFAGSEQLQYSGPAGTFTLTTRPAVSAGYFTAMIEVANGCSVMLSANGPSVAQGNLMAVDQLSSNVYRVMGSLNPERFGQDDALDAQVDIVGAACN